MTDASFSPPRPETQKPPKKGGGQGPAADDLGPDNFSEEELRQGIELLFFAYRDFTADPDTILEEWGFGRAHHRVIHFLGRNPEITIGDLLALLRITKQSLNRVLRALLSQGLVAQRTGTRDRRQRHLYLTPTGIALESRLSAPQKARVANAFRTAGPDAIAGFKQVLALLLDAEQRERVLKAISQP
jgi:DNA-binding MarR family transcriptional regulator